MTKRQEGTFQAERRIEKTLGYISQQCKSCKDCDEYDCPNWIIRCLLQGQPPARCVECGDPVDELPDDAAAPICGTCKTQGENR